MRTEQEIELAITLLKTVMVGDESTKREKEIAHSGLDILSWVKEGPNNFGTFVDQCSKLMGNKQ